MEEQLIVEVEKRPVLYDKSLGSYKNANFREEIWKEVAKELKTDDVNSVKKRWRSLRDTFIKIHRNQKFSSGSGGGKKSKWSYYSQMTFLLPYIEFRETIGNYSNSEMCIQKRNNNPERETDFINDVPTTPERNNDVPITQKRNEQFENNIRSRIIKCPSATKKRKNKTPEDNIDEKILNIISKEHDADEQFLLSYLPTLKRMTPKQNAIAKIKIQQVLFDVEFGNNYSNSPLSSNSGHSTYSSAPVLTRYS